MYAIRSYYDVLVQPSGVEDLSGSGAVIALQDDSPDGFVSAFNELLKSYNFV